jgi:hypothetical protein
MIKHGFKNLSVTAQVSDMLIKKLTDLIITYDDMEKITYDSTVIVFITAKNNLEKDLGIWSSIIELEINGTTYLCINMAQVSKDGAMDNSVTTIFQKKRATYTALYNERVAGSIKAALPILVSDWVTKSLARDFSLTMEEIIHVEGLVMLYYRYMVTGKMDIAFVQNNSNLHMSPNSKSILNDLEEPKNIDTLVTYLRNRVDNKRLNNLSRYALVTVINKGWISKDGGDDTMTALEHPPTMLAMISTAMEYGLYKRLPLFNILKNNSSKTAIVSREARAMDHKALGA